MRAHPSRYPGHWPPPPPGAVAVYRLTREQYEAMVAHGILGEDETVELLEGILIWKGVYHIRAEQIARVEYLEEDP